MLTSSTLAFLLYPIFSVSDSSALIASSPESKNISSSFVSGSSMSVISSLSSLSAMSDSGCVSSGSCSASSVASTSFSAEIFSAKSSAYTILQGSALSIAAKRIDTNFLFIFLLLLFVFICNFMTVLCYFQYVACLVAIFFNYLPQNTPFPPTVQHLHIENTLFEIYNAL